MKYGKYLALTTGVLLIAGGTWLLLDTESAALLACKKELAVLDRDFMEASIARSDYEQQSMLHEMVLKEIDSCLKLERVDDIRQCVKSHISF